MPPTLRRPFALAVGLLVLAACHPASAPAASVAPSVDPGAARIQADVAVLADDAMQGRETGTAGYERAADAVVARLRDAGLQPAGDAGTYSQRVPLLKATRLAEGARFDVIRRDRTIALRFRDHFLPEPNFDAADSALRAPAVFVGEGVSAPALKHDDYAGLDVRGKVAVLLGGAPVRFDDDQRAFFASASEKLHAAAAHGATGVVFVDTAQDEARAPWAVRAVNWDRASLRLRDADGHGIDTVPQLKVVARMSAAAADLLFDGSGHTAAQLASAAQAGTLRGFALPVTLSLAARTHVEPIQSRNVVGMLQGSDPALKDEAIVFSAHLDHLGVGAPVDGDAIRNGALDNALGVAIVLETARALHAAAPKRSLLFVALTGEEQGLLGAQWFAMHPPARLVADVNLDMPMLLAPTRDVVPIGARHSTLQASLAQAAKALDIGLSADPFPEEGVFVRSDQFAFVRAGVPSLYLDGGVVPGPASAGKPADVHTLPRLAQREFLRRCYHQPCDDIHQPIQYADAARMARLNARLGVLLGDAVQPPRWQPGDFFGTRFGAPRRP
jgi:Zn-dependent M28 family amino/carboxypeptidase